MAVKQDGIPSGRSTTDYLAVLDDRHRRAAVGILAANDRPATLSSLAAEVAAEIREETSERDVERVKIELHHNHLPKLDEAGVLGYRSESHRVVPTGDLQTAADLAETIDTN